MFCKTIILSNSNNVNTNSPKGILTLSKQDNNILGKIRLYNISALPNNCKIGLYVNEQVHTAPIVKKPHHFEFIVLSNIDITQSIYCAIIDDSASDKKVLLEGGSFNGFYFSDSPMDAILEAKDSDLDQQISDSIADSTCDNHPNCANCEYKAFFYQHNFPSSDIQSIPELDININTIKDNKLKDSSVNETILNPVIEADTKFIRSEQENLAEAKPDNERLEFLNEIIYQMDEMFAKYPSDEMLNAIIPNSKFIKVDGSQPYVLGAMYENKLLKYIAYGIPATYNDNPPTDFGKHYQWLPLNPNDIISDGYYMIYQDATDGTIVEINFE